MTQLMNDDVDTDIPVLMVTLQLLTQLTPLKDFHEVHMLLHQNIGSAPP